MSQLELRGVSKRYGDVDAVSSFDLRIEAGEFVSLVGPSGCGKTTTLMMIAGFERPDAGSISVDGRTLSGPGTYVRPEHRSMAMVFQSNSNWPHMTIYDNVIYGLRIRRSERRSRQECRRRFADAMALVDLDPDLAVRYPWQLSGGQQQRVALARALIVEPRVLLLDEPLSHLDARLREGMRDDLRALQRRTSVTFVYVTHDRQEALGMSDRIVVLNHGETHQIGTPRDILDRPASPFVAQLVGAQNVISGRLTDSTTFRLAGEGPILRLPEEGDPLRLGNTVITIRRDGFELTQHGGPEFTTGEVTKSAYMGTGVEYSVLVGGEVIELWAQSSDHVYDVGQIVDMRLVAGRYSIFYAGQGGELKQVSEAGAS